MPARKNVLLRLDPAVYDAVARWAADDLRSVNSQIEYALRRALRAAGRPVRIASDAPDAPDGADTADAPDDAEGAAEGPGGAEEVAEAPVESPSSRTDPVE
jgi:hypothetical protein